MANLDSILKSRAITLPTNVHIVKCMVYPVVMYGCESWTIKKSEHQIIDDFELWCWWRLLRVPRPARKSKQSVLKEINPEYSLEELMLNLKLQYFGHRLNSCGTQTELLCGMWDLHGPGIKPVSPALASKLFITQPARKHSPSNLNYRLW